MPMAAILRSGPFRQPVIQTPARPLIRHGVDAVVGHHGDHDGLETFHVVADAGAVLELEDRVGDKLARAVPGQFAAAVHGHDGGAVEGPFVVLREFAGRIDGGVLEEQDGAVLLARNNFVVDFALQVPALHVINEIRGKTQL